MRQMYYKLVGKESVAVGNFTEWVDSQKDDNNRVIKRIQFGRILVSTIFLSLDFNWSGGRPILFETMIFGGIHGNYQKRYYTYDEALEGHRIACVMATKGIKVERYFNKNKSAINQKLTFKNKRQWRTMTKQNGQKLKKG